MDANVTVWLDNLSKAARGEAAPPPSDTLLSIENRVKDATDDDLSGITSQLFGLHGLPEAIVASLDGETAEMRTPEKKELREAALRFLEVLVDTAEEPRFKEARQQAQRPIERVVLDAWAAAAGVAVQVAPRPLPLVAAARGRRRNGTSTSTSSGGGGARSFVAVVVARGGGAGPGDGEEEAAAVRQPERRKGIDAGGQAARSAQRG